MYRSTASSPSHRQADQPPTPKAETLKQASEGWDQVPRRKKMRKRKEDVK